MVQVKPYKNLMYTLNPLPDDNFKFDENTRKLSKRVKTTVDKGEIARYEQFLLSPQCFQKACLPGASKVLLCGNGLRPHFQFSTLESWSQFVLIVSPMSFEMGYFRSKTGSLVKPILITEGL